MNNGIDHGRIADIGPETLIKNNQIGRPSRPHDNSFCHDSALEEGPSGPVNTKIAVDNNYKKKNERNLIILEITAHTASRYWILWLLSESVPARIRTPFNTKNTVTGH
jgi:hypothetical protein